ncbi:MAG: hypothetical protein JJE29_00450 [Peptostreptococcaceae bacterium]|nr:hypothetical protein [Peptostreptococcaceae bacterium]
MNELIDSYNSMVNTINEMVYNTGMIDDYIDRLKQDLMEKLNPMADQLEAIMVIMFVLVALQMITMIVVFSLNSQIKSLKGELKDGKPNIERNRRDSSIGSEPSTDGNGVRGTDSGRKTVYTSGSGRISPVKRKKP